MSKYCQKYLPGLLVALFVCTINYSCKSSKEASSISNFPEKYTVDIPYSWVKKTKIVKALTDVLPATTSELKDREFCLNCTAGYTVKLIIEDAKIETYSTDASGNITAFRFKADFVVYNKQNIGIVKISIVDPEKDLFLWRTAGGGGGGYMTPTTILRGQNVGLGKYNTYQMDMSDYSSQYSYSRRTRGRGGSNKMIIDKTVLLNYTEQKLYAMRDMIQGWEVK